MATNRIDILDPALLRPGRIDRKIEFPNPNESSRADILRIHSRKMNLVRGIDLRKIADKMTGASGAELKVRPCQCSWNSGPRACSAVLLSLLFTQNVLRCPPAYAAIKRCRLHWPHTLGPKLYHTVDPTET